MRKILTSLLAAAALGAVAEPASAGINCTNWQPDTTNAIYQSNGWNASLWYGADGYWRSTAMNPGQSAMTGKVMFSSWSASLVKFTITWPNGSAGIYEGRIDANGFVSGIAKDRYTGAWATWRFRDVAICAG